MSGSNSTLLPMFDKLIGRNNYSDWSFAMRAFLEHEDLWCCIEGNDQTTDAAEKEKRDTKAKSKLIMMIHPSNYVHVRNAKSAKDVWDNLKNAFLDSGLSRKVSLMRKMITTKLEDCSSMEEYISIMVSTSQQLNTIKFEISEEWLGAFLLSGLPESYQPMIMAIESSGATVTGDFVKTKLLQEENPSQQGNANNSAFYTRKPKRKSGPRCYNCNIYGHIAANCRKPKKKERNHKENRSLLATLATGKMNNSEWYVDSGATTHMTNDISVLSNVTNISFNKEVVMADNRKLTVKSIGDCYLNILVDKHEREVKISNVLYVPKLAANLLSISQIVKNGNKVIFDKNNCRIYDKENKILATASLQDNVYKLDRINEEKSFYTSESSNVWHRRLGHLNEVYMKQLEKLYKIKLTNGNSVDKCIVCLQGKHSKEPFKQSSTVTKRKLELVHSDLCGPIEVMSIGGSKYFMTFIDDFTHKVFVYFLKSKDEAVEKFKEFKSFAENQSGYKIKAVRTDNGREYANERLMKFLRENGIQHQTSVPYNPQQNGKAERMNRTIVEKARCLLLDSGLNKKFWAEAVNTSVYLINKSPSVTLKDMTPDEAWFGVKPDLSNLKIFGSDIMVYIPKNKRRKFDPKSERNIFVGYCENQKGYRVYDPKFKIVKCIRDGVFIENNRNLIHEIEICNNNDNNNNNIILFPTELVEAKNKNGDLPENINTVGAENENIDLPENVELTESRDAGLSDSIEENQITSEEEYLSPDPDDEYIPNVQLGPNTEVRRSQRQPKPNKLNDYVYSASDISYEDPLTVEEALNRPDARKWKEAMEEEYSALIKNNTWTLANLPKNKMPIQNKWVFKRKLNSDGTHRYKARLVIKGCAQRKGIDYTETFAPVIKYNTIRYLLAVAIQHDMEIHQMDANTAFLQGELAEDIYMQQPELYKKGDLVCKLNKSIYGLKQASRVWNIKLDDVLTNKIGLKRSKVDSCLYYFIQDTRKLFIAIYVDDLIIFSNDKNLTHQIKTSLQSHFSMKDLGKLTNCLGIHIIRKENVLWLDQEDYIKDILHRFNMINCNSVSTPVDNNVKLNKQMCPETEEEKKEMKNIPYKEAVGSLLYLSQCTRPDISYAVNQVCRYTSNPGKQHWSAVKRIFRYLKGTLSYKLKYEKSDTSTVYGYSDADWASDLDERKSTTGYVFLKGKCVITWNVKRQHTVALSTTEAEYMALTAAAQEAKWLKKLEEEICQKENVNMIIYCDNRSAINLSSNDTYHPRTKHIDLRHHFIRDSIQKKEITVMPISTKEMVADMFTKGLSRDKYENLCKMLNINFSGSVRN